MKVKIVPKSKVKVSRSSSSKYQPLIDAVDKLKSGGDALRVKYSDERELNSMRNIIYTINREQGKKIKSNKDPQNKIVYFYIE
jgi:DNA helicase IV